MIKTENLEATFRSFIFRPNVGFKMIFGKKAVFDQAEENKNKIKIFCSKITIFFF